METMPVEHKRDRGGEHILFNARARSMVAKQGGDALSDLGQRDIDSKPTGWGHGESCCFDQVAAVRNCVTTYDRH